MIKQEILDLSQLHSYPSDFDLLIFPPEKLKVAIFQNATKVACLIDQVIRISCIWTLDEGFTRQFRPVVVTQSSIRRTDVYLTDFSWRADISPRADYHRLGAFHGFADWNRPAI